MQNYRRGSHTVYDLKYHLVWCTKYRRGALLGEVGLRVRDLVREICLAHEVTILKGHVAKDHVHLFVSSPPSVSVSRLMQHRDWARSGEEMLRPYSQNAHLLSALDVEGDDVTKEDP